VLKRLGSGALQRHDAGHARGSVERRSEVLPRRAHGGGDQHAAHRTLGAELAARGERAADLRRSRDAGPERFAACFQHDQDLRQVHFERSDGGFELQLARGIETSLGFDFHREARRSALRFGAGAGVAAALAVRVCAAAARELAAFALQRGVVGIALAVALDLHVRAALACRVAMAVALTLALDLGRVSVERAGAFALAVAAAVSLNASAVRGRATGGASRAGAFALALAVDLGAAAGLAATGAFAGARASAGNVGRARSGAATATLDAQGAARAHRRVGLDVTLGLDVTRSLAIGLCGDRCGALRLLEANGGFAAQPAARAEVCADLRLGQVTPSREGGRARGGGDFGVVRVSAQVERDVATRGRPVGDGTGADCRKIGRRRSEGRERTFDAGIDPEVDRAHVRAGFELFAAGGVLGVFEIATTGDQSRDSECSERDSGERFQAIFQVHAKGLLRVSRALPTTTMRFGAFPSSDVS